MLDKFKLSKLKDKQEAEAKENETPEEARPPKAAGRKKNKAK